MGYWLNYYKRHLGDYAVSTMCLSVLEHGAYSLILDGYYWHERAPTTQEAFAWGRATNKKERAVVSAVLAEFFTLVDGRHVNRRCEREIAAYRKAVAAASSFWGQIPREVRTAMEAKRRARKLCATPAWLTPEHMSDIAAVYAAARQMGIESGVAHDVDHIVPLQGEAVCGLHVPWNLRAIPAHENRRKGRSL